MHPRRATGADFSCGFLARMFHVGFSWRSRIAMIGS